MRNISKNKIIIIVVSLIIIGIITSILFNVKNVKEVHNIVELENCAEGDFIRIKISRAYATDYWYEKDGIQVARFIDIEMNGKALIALVEKEEAEKLTQNETEEMYIEGILQTFKDEEMVAAYEGIKQNYLEDFSEQMTEEEILNLFTPLQLLCYEI